MSVQARLNRKKQPKFVSQSKPIEHIQTSETETEVEVNMTPEVLAKSLSWTIGTPKLVPQKKPGEATPPKKSDMTKRLVVGFSVLALFLVGMYIGPVAAVLPLYVSAWSTCWEAYEIKKKEFEDSKYAVFSLHLWSFITINFMFLPKIGLLRRFFVEQSGIHRRDYPLLFTVLYDRHEEICLLLVTLIFMAAVVKWRNRNLKYQLRKTLGHFTLIFYSAMFTHAPHTVLLFAGRYWVYYSMLSVSCNDTFAYFAGRLFGRHHLIGLSPNKTVEGFIGGAIANVINTGIVCYFVMKGDFWLCGVDRLTVLPFEDFHCKSLSPIYSDQVVQLPFSVMGVSAVTVQPAVLHSVVLALFASLVAPYVGFFASGFKRGSGIKDFAQTLPGHGGFIDRLDCVSLMGIFSFFYCTQVVFRDKYDMIGAYESAMNLPDEDKLQIVNALAQKFDLKGM